MYAIRRVYPHVIVTCRAASGSNPPCVRQSCILLSILVEVYAHLTGALFRQSIAVPTEDGDQRIVLDCAPRLLVVLRCDCILTNTTMRAVLIPLRLRYSGFDEQ